MTEPHAATPEYENPALSLEIQAALEAYQRGELGIALTLAETPAGQPGQHQGMALLLIANIHLKQEKRLEAGRYFVLAAEHVPEKHDEFMKFALRLLLEDRSAQMLAEMAEKLGRGLSGQPDLLHQLGHKLLSKGHHWALEKVMPFLDPENNWHLQLMISHYQLMRQPEKLHPILTARYVKHPDDSFVAQNYFSFCRSSLNFDGSRLWLDMLANQPESVLVQEILSRDMPLSRRYWSDDEAILASPCSYLDYLLRNAAPIATKRRAISPAGKKLRIGYVSSDYSVHATMYLLYDVFVAHDRTRFDITHFCHTHLGQAGVQKEWDETFRREIISIADMSDEEAASLIAERQIDILVDLKGHTTNYRGNLIRQSDSPVKATWIGYPGSVIRSGLDYHVTDRIVTPDAAKPWFEEKLCRLPDTYQGNCSFTKPQPKPMTRAEAGLPEDRFIFASFNAPGKISPQTLDLWVEVLKSVPDSLFWILCNGDLLRGNFLKEINRLGIASERILFAEGLAYPLHVSRVGLADLALDSFPYNGHTTTSDLLWGGLPVLTKKGKTFAARVSQSLLSAIGLNDLVAENEADFVQKAVHLAQDKAEMTELKQRLWRNRSTYPLFDTLRFTRHLERAYEQMAERARAGLPPDHIDVEALPA